MQEGNVMCGRLNVSDDPFVTQLLLDLGIENPKENMHFGRFKRATDIISIVTEKNGKRQLIPATWWLLLESTETGFKPSKYTSFNSRYDKLNVPGSAAYKPFRESRCVIVTKGFGETEFRDKKPLHYHDFEAVEGALALGGLYKEWQHKGTGEIIYSCSVITLPAHDKIKPYHSKASPLMLPQQDNTIDLWLDEHNQQVAMFNDLLQPKLHQALNVYPIDKPSSYLPIGESNKVERDIA
ncbi:hypothetical protein AX660_10415 [Paraglaciecola hydrolytica]|uniref:Abasic site processing protein n=2 Tax=Paraglaciecola hydrolytica TaxID=1799789 RepID=A0A136A5R2_9ALTE|nr:hypothetical protein AX660_10415 [Paraglaciecola hydrolytica]